MPCSCECKGPNSITRKCLDTKDGTGRIETLLTSREVVPNSSIHQCIASQIQGTRGEKVIKLSIVRPEESCDD